jgi:hypothetical protein
MRTMSDEERAIIEKQLTVNKRPFMRKVMIWGVVGLLVLVCIVEILFMVSLARPSAHQYVRYLPENPIVFTIPDLSQRTLGFIDPDGKHFTIRQIDIPVPGVISLNFTNPAVWNADGTILTTHLQEHSIATVGGEKIPLLVTQEGDLLVCEKFPVFIHSVWAVDSTHVLISTAIEDGLGSQIVSVDMETCQTGDVIYTDPVGIRRFAISAHGWIAYERSEWFYGPPRTVLAVVDDQYREIFAIEDSSAPSWSRDGEWLAYHDYDGGIYIVRRSGIDEQLIVSDGLYPSWSPDGEWLVYQLKTENGTDIYKVNIATKETMLLYSGGMYPSWR